MSRKEELKTMIDLYKALLLSFLTALFGILGYTFINYDDFTIAKIIIIYCYSPFCLRGYLFNAFS